MTADPADTAIVRPVGHDAIIERLERLSRAGTLPHALIFSGSAGVGKFLTARWWTTRLKCEREGCGGRCPGCVQVAAGTHPDVCLLEPESPGKEIKIDPVRDDVIRALSFKPARSGPRIALIREAHLLNHHAQSAMLKLLEEPPGSALIILVTGNLAALMPTIRSRCQILRFGPLSEDALHALLIDRGRSPELARMAAQVARGSAGRALDLTPEALAERESILLAFERYHGGESADVEGLVAELRERRKAGRPGLDALFEWQLRKVEASLGRAVSTGSDQLAPFVADLTPAHMPPLLALAQRIHWTIGALERNANARLAIRDLLYDAEPA